MGDVRTALSPAQEGGFWRVRIAWPNGKVNYFGKFTSEADVVRWISAHNWLTKPISEKLVREDWEM
jgi:hypothetical protein